YMKTDSRRNYSFPRIVNNEYLTVSVISFCNLHNDWIVQIKWIDDLDFFVSCALTSTRNLYIGDLNKKMEKYAVTKKGFAVFDYCKAHRSIVTGSNDGVIRFWDPFVTERAAAILRGHNSSVTHLVVDNRENHIIRIDKGKNQNKDSEIQKTSNHIQPQSNIHHESNDSTLNHVRKLDIEETREWIQRRERLQQIIKLDRINFIPITKKRIR
ncbi:unnamed protein product, partial [Rotaria sp. Silwood1]